MNSHPCNNYLQGSLKSGARWLNSASSATEAVLVSEGKNGFHLRHLSCLYVLIIGPLLLNLCRSIIKRLFADLEVIFF